MFSLLLLQIHPKTSRESQIRYASECSHHPRPSYMPVAGHNPGHVKVPAVLSAFPSNPPKDFPYMAGSNIDYVQVPSDLSAFRPYTTQTANYPSHILNTGTNTPSSVSTSGHHGTQSTPAYFQHDNVPGGSTLSPGVPPQHNTHPGADSDVHTTPQLGLDPQLGR